MGLKSPSLAAWLATLSLAVAARAQMIAPTNGSYPFNPTSESVSLNGNGFQYGIVPESTSTLDNVPAISGLSGTVLVATSQTISHAGSNNIALISCDPLGNDSAAVNMFTQAIHANVLAVILYSTESFWCRLNYTASSPPVFSMMSAGDSLQLLSRLGNATNSNSQTVAIIPGLSSSVIGGGNSTSPAGGLGPPGTAVAMIILYAITGVISAIFVFIIVSGAIRAHRHPERYGPRRGIGMPRQSRARGLAKAMLDTLPIVRFGERDEPAKPVDVEMADASHGPVETVPDDIPALVQDEITHAALVGATPQGGGKEPASPTVNEDSASPVSKARPHSLAQYDNQGCSICTEDFEVGQEQRVLPCDHRFHPACIDPWLLNVSGTCPLCRIDLRPAGGPTRHRDDEAWPHGELAPPLDPMEGGAVWRSTVRRSTIFNVFGTSRPNSMTREQRLLALRELRRHNIGRTRGGDSTDTVHIVEEENTIRRRLRNSFHIRTSRTGEAHDVEVPPIPANFQVPDNAAPSGAQPSGPSGPSGAA